MYFIRHSEHSQLPYQRGKHQINKCLTFSKLPYLFRHQNPHLLRVVGKRVCLEIALNGAWNAVGMQM